jgi:ankyrin repeat protein
MTALILAAQDGKLAVVKYLSEQGSQINATSLIGWSALMTAVAHPETARYLVDRGAKLNLQDEDGWSAVQLAARQGSFGTVVMLCEAGADVYLKDKHGSTAVDVAKTEAIREYLVGYHKEKDSGLMGACRSGNVEQVGLLW